MTELNCRDKLGYPIKCNDCFQYHNSLCAYDFHDRMSKKEFEEKET